MRLHSIPAIDLSSEELKEELKRSEELLQAVCQESSVNFLGVSL